MTQFTFRDTDELSEASLNPDPKLKMVVSSISEGNTEGEIWSYGENTYFLWDKGNIVFYIFGERPSSRCLDDLPRFFEDEIVEDAREGNYSHFKLDDRTGLAEEKLLSAFGDYDLRTLEKYFYEYPEEDVGDFESSLEGLELMDIDEDFLTNTDLRDLVLVINEIKWMWPSFETYFENGFGKAAVLSGDIICWCTAEYVSESMCGVGIETLERYRGKGVASVTAAEFVRGCLEEGITPYWECGASNVASVKLAEKLAFEKIAENKVLWDRF